MNEEFLKEIQKRFTYIAARLVALSAILINKGVCSEDELNTLIAATDFQLEANIQVQEAQEKESKSDEQQDERNPGERESNPG